jgi:transcriptional accessory protein Tex/SPT6|tara:strand:- start:660 stop:926 length:267 start_codon:yes stop_codon:yes gene_type:complete
MLSKSEIKTILLEELSGADKSEIRTLIAKEFDKSFKRELKKALEDELEKALSSKETKEGIADVTKKVMKKLYKDLSLQHPYIIDRIKV